MVTKCKNQTLCEYCDENINVGDFMNILTVDNHNMGHTHKIVFTHDRCTDTYLRKQYVVD